MRISVIVCTYRRAADLERLCACLAAQDFGDFEVIVVDGSGADACVRETVDRCIEAHPTAIVPRLVSTAAGLSRQRNVGLAEATGEIIGFLDDDVTFGPAFLRGVAAVAAEAGMAGVGGFTGFDECSYAQPIRWHRRLTRLLGVIPSLQPGDIDRVGRRVPFDIAGPSPLRRKVGWLPGFCMFYRREAIAGMRFDEGLPNYAGEDRAFSAAVGAAHPLMLCTDLRLRHHRSEVAREGEARRVYHVGFGMGRGFALRHLSPADRIAAAHYTVGATALHALRFLHRPSRHRLASIGAIPLGVLAGYRSREDRR